MILTFRPIKVHPPDWKPARARRPTAPFGAGYQRTLTDLEREIRHLGGSDPFLQADVDDDDLRLDGQLRANAQVRHPGVLLTFDSKDHGTLVYSTDAYHHWHDNLRAIALGLDCLRRVERYGIGSRGQQYAGYRELGAAVPGIAVGAAMTIDQAAAFIADNSIESPISGWPAFTPLQVLTDPSARAAAYRIAARRLHPDTGGDAAQFRQLNEARDLLNGRAS